MGFLRRLFGGGDAPEAADAPAEADDGVDADEAERQHEREVLRAEAERLDPLRQRQLRYADRAWTPPSQGGDRRADDEAATEGG
jgi:hypothetical protein